MKGGKKSTSMDPPPPPEPTAENGGGGPKCVENDQNPPLPPPLSLDAPAGDDRQKQLEENGGAAVAEKEGAAVAAATEDEEEEEEEEEEGEKGNDQVDELLTEEGGEGEGEGEKAKLDEGYYEIEAVRRKRVRKGQVQYLIKWRGWPETDNTWEPLDNLLSCSDVIEAFDESLRSGKRSARRRKRKYGSTQTQTKKKQQQRSPAAATYNVPAVKVRILEKPLPFPPINGPSTTNGEASVSGVKNVELAKRVNENGVNSVTCRTEPLEETNELNLKISELKGVAISNENCVDKFAIDSQEALLSEQVGIANGLPRADCLEPVQSGRCTGAKRRKSGSVKRFKQDLPSGTEENLQNVAAANGSYGMTGNLGSHSSDLMANDLRPRNRVESSRICDITEIVKPVSYSPSLLSNSQDMLITFMAKRSDGSEVTVDNKFLKANHPVLLINFYEKHLRYTSA